MGDKDINVLEGLYRAHTNEVTRMGLKVYQVIKHVFSTNGVVNGDDSDRKSRDATFQSPGGRILQLLDEAGGYRWQGEIVTDLEWSESKTSRTLSELEESGHVTRYQLGRRKVVCLPSREPDALRRNSSHQTA